MIRKLSHATIYVLDQDASLKFYRDVLGFEVRTDATMDNGFRWLTVGPKTQPDMELILMALNPGPMLDEKTCDQLRDMVKRGVFGIGVFETDDCRATYEELKGRGAEFMGPPEDRFYGTEAIGKDNNGNWFSMTQRPKK
jgi:catechol 2,3-dioxygenase-like lactoylglutathione lyase family enzyme